MLPVPVKLSDEDRALNEIIAQIDMDVVPDRFIAMLRVQFNDGTHKDMTQEEVDEMFFKQAGYYGLTERHWYALFDIEGIRALVDLSKVRAEVRELSTSILSSIAK